MKDIFMAVKMMSEYNYEEKQKCHKKGEEFPDEWLRNEISNV